MNSNGILYLTVTAEGQLTLWESTKAAIEGKGTTDTVLQLSLTQHQMIQVARAEVLATTKKREMQSPAAIAADWKLRGL